MKRTAAVLLVVLSAAVAFGAHGAGEWIKYTSPEGRYSVLLPSEPQLSTQESTTANGGNLPQHLASVFDSSVFYLIGYFDYAAQMTFSLDKVRDGTVAAVNGTLLGEESISLGGHPGREIRISFKNEDAAEGIARVRVYDVDRRVYVIEFITLKSDELGATDKATKYFDSFKVVNTP